MKSEKNNNTVLIIVLAVALIIIFGGFGMMGFNGCSSGGFNNYGMMSRFYGGYGFGFMPMFGMIFWIVALIFFVIWIVSWLQKSGAKR